MIMKMIIVVNWKGRIEENHKQSRDGRCPAETHSNWLSAEYGWGMLLSLELTSFIRIWHDSVGLSRKLAV
jgi:hypothetical protein